ncbi:MAG: phosphoribosylanthranilate isomerase [Treponema sp.]|jgi:phosphoribosylanthranilate isomerase|nr:phosphoribosylanthranilate isomerase [Treponema sp.]
MKIKICGLFRDEDVDYVNEARPDYIGFVFAQGRRNVSPEQAARMRRRLLDDIVPVGVFVNAPIEDIVSFYHNGVIAIAQLHGNEDDEYIIRLREAAARGQKTMLIIKAVKSDELEAGKTTASNPDCYLIDSGAGSGRAFNWNILAPCKESRNLGGKPWFLAGGIGLENIEKAITLKPFALDISSGAETDGIKDRKKIIQLTTTVRMADKL